MPNYSFNEIVSFFSEKLKIKKFEEDSKGMTLVLDKVSVDLSPAKAHGGFQLSIALGLLLQPIPENRLRELMTSHFLGVNTGGCTFFFDEPSVSVCLKMATSPYTSPQENWEWLHRLISIGHEWVKVLSLWDEFVPLLPGLPEAGFEKGVRI